MTWDRSLYRPDEDEAKVLLRLTVEMLSAAPFAVEHWSLQDQALLRRAYRRLERDLGATVECRVCGADPVAHADLDPVHEPEFVTGYGGET